MNLNISPVYPPFYFFVARSSLLSFDFQAMSVVICGAVIPRESLSPATIQALTSSADKPSLVAPSSSPSALVPPPPPPPPRRASLSSSSSSAPPPPPPHAKNQQQQDMDVVPPPPPARRPTRATQPPVPGGGGSGNGGGGSTGTGGVSGGGAQRGAMAPTGVAASKGRRPEGAAAAKRSAAVVGPASPPLPSADDASKKAPSLPRSWTPLGLPSVETSAAAAAGGVGGAETGAGAGDKGGGVSPADLAPYGEAELSVALSVAPGRLQRFAAEANPFDDRLLVPASAANRVREAVELLVSLADDEGPAGRDAEVREASERWEGACINNCFHRSEVKWCERERSGLLFFSYCVVCVEIGVGVGTVAPKKKSVFNHATNAPRRLVIGTLLTHTDRKITCETSEKIRATLFFGC